MNIDVLIGVLYGIILTLQVYICIQCYKAYKQSKKVQELLEGRGVTDDCSNR